MFTFRMAWPANAGHLGDTRAGTGTLQSFAASASFQLGSPHSRAMTKLDNELETKVANITNFVLDHSCGRITCFADPLFAAAVS